MKFRNFPNNFDFNFNKGVLVYLNKRDEVAKRYNRELIVSYINTEFQSIYGKSKGLTCCLIEPHRSEKKYALNYCIFDEDNANPYNRVGEYLTSLDDAIFFVDSIVNIKTTLELTEKEFKRSLKNKSLV